MAGAASGPSAATVMMAATTRSTGMTSIVPSGNPGKLTQQSAGVGDQHGLGHPEPADPARSRLGQRGLDDRRAHDAHRHVALDIHQRLLAERFREGVGVGPADAGRPGPSGRDQLVAHPALAQLLRLRRQRRRTRSSELETGLLAQRGQPVGLAAGRLGVAAQPAGRFDLGPPVQAEVERAGADQLLGRRAAPVASDVARRHRHQVRSNVRAPAAAGRRVSVRAG